jgi:hypothetical protein
MKQQIMTFDNSKIKKTTAHTVPSSVGDVTEIHLPEPSSPTRSPYAIPEETENEINASPLHFHVGENAKLMAKPRPPRSRSHSRSRDPSPMTCRTPSNSGRSRSNSNASSGYISAEDIHVDPDILLDKMGHEDLEQPKHVDVHSLRASLPIVNERMSEESLDDCHAFSDLKDAIRQISRDSGPSLVFGGGSNAAISSRSSENSLSREGSMAGGSVLDDGGHLLETLEEFEEEEEDEEDNNEQEDNSQITSTGNKEESSNDNDQDVSDGQNRIDPSAPSEKKKRFGFFKKNKAKAVPTDSTVSK